MDFVDFFRSFSKIITILLTIKIIKKFCIELVIFGATLLR